MDTRVQRDVLIEEIYKHMGNNKSIYFISADFGSPVLDKLRAEFNDRFTNVGIAEQNLVSIATGLALEGYTVYAYAIAPFIMMRAYEQIRTGLSMLSQIREINVNLIGVGIGLSYDVTGATHHCLEDLGIIRTLPNIAIFSPSDHVLVGNFVAYSLHVKTPKYIRLDGKPLPRIYDTNSTAIEDGFRSLKQGSNICIVSTGYMTHKAIRVARRLAEAGIDVGIVDFFLIKPFRKEKLLGELLKYRHIVTLEESFIGKGGLDSAVSEVLREANPPVKLTPLGFEDKYTFNVGDREYLHRLNNLDDEAVVKRIVEISKGNSNG